MSIANYSDLKTAIEKWAAREGDTNVSGNAADFVTLGEARLNRLLSAVQINLIDDTATLVGVTSSRELTVPSNLVEPIALFLTTYTIQTLLRPFIVGTLELSTTSGIPQAWGFNEDHIDLDVPCDQAHTFLLRYRKSFALSDASPTNWLLTNNPDAYLAACMVEYFLFAMNEERAALWQQRLNTAIEEIQWKESRAQALAPLRVDAALLPGYPVFNYTTGQ